VALLAPQDPAAAACELERAVKDLGMIAGMLPGVISPMRGLGLPDFDPIYRTAERLDVALAVHSGPAVELGLDHIQSFAGVYPLSHPFAQMQQLTSMMIYGVFERFPALRVAYLESGCGWVPYLADRLDESWEHRRGRWPHPIKQSPSEIMRGGNLFYACEREEKTLPAVVQLIGADQLLWASDFPHERPWDEFAGDIDTLLNREDLPKSLGRKILFDNPRRFYKLEI
jgi:predicted TIM-barrel fold metal-dependent hydrolase